MYSLLFIVFIILACLKVSLSDTNCVKLDVFLSQKVENAGFHRQIHWLIEMNSPSESEWMQSGCNLTLQLVLTSGMYVNPDEIAELNRIGQPAAYIDGQVDVEQPSHEAKEHTIYVFLPNTDPNMLRVKIPIHLRYQRSQIGGGFGKVLLHKPILLCYCQESQTKICGKGLKVEAPCTVDGEELCVWKNVSYGSTIDDTELFVPIGDLNDYPVVSIVTLLLGCAGCIYVLSVLSTRPL